MKAILACDKNMLIGLNGKLPFDCPAEMKHFKETTKGHIVVMGWNTWVSLGEKPLKDRVNIVLTSDNFYDLDVDDKIYTCVHSEFSMCKEWLKNEYSDKEIFCIGGAATFEILREHITEVILSVIDTKVDVFPNDKRVYLPCLKEFMLHSVQKKEGFEVNRYVRLP